MDLVKVSKEGLLALGACMISLAVASPTLPEKIIWIVAGLVVIGIRTWTKGL